MVAHNLSLGSGEQGYRRYLRTAWAPRPHGLVYLGLYHSMGLPNNTLLYVVLCIKQQNNVNSTPEAILSTPKQIFTIDCCTFSKMCNKVSIL